MRTSPSTSWAFAIGVALLAGCEKGPPDLSKPDPAASGSATKVAASQVPSALQPPPKPQVPPPPDVAAPPADAVKTASGLASKVLTPGTGTEHPGPVDQVKVHYTGWTTDGKTFDSSVARGQPASFTLDHVIKGWTEGLQLMVVGEKRRLWIPKELAYNDQPGRPAGMLVFDVELLDMHVAPKTPPDVAAPPKDAVVEKSGLATKVLTKGTGTAHPAANSRVSVNYAGWTTDGKMFDSNFSRGQPQELGVAQVIPGWTEALQMMVEGEKRRLWIPEALAYKGQKGAPAGMLVFDVELVKITATPAAPLPSVPPSAPPPKPSASK
jgi:FKBP-type peptidyl-prolyl cis-trans isomerase